MGFASAPVSATSAALDGCRLLIASRSASLTDADRENLGTSSFVKLIEVARHDRSLRRVFAKEPPSLPPIVRWCRARYTDKQLHRISTAELLMQIG
jgi:hypothetical protein